MSTWCTQYIKPTLFGQSVAMCGRLVELFILILGFYGAIQICI